MVFNMNVGLVNQIYVSWDCTLLLMDNGNSLFLFRIIRTFVPPKVFPQITIHSKKDNSNKKWKPTKKEIQTKKEQISIIKQLIKKK